MYCVYLTFYSGNKLPPFYIGYCKTSKIKKGYKGSVSSKRYKDVWKKELCENPQSFRTTVIREYDTRGRAVEAELRLQRAVRAWSNPMYVNMATFPHFCGPHTPEHSAKIGDALRGKKKSPEAIKNNSLAQKRLYENGYVNPFQGKTHSPEIIEKIKEKRAHQTISDDTKEKMRQARIAFWKSESGLLLKKKMKSKNRDQTGRFASSSH